MFHLTIIATLLSSFVFVCTAVVDLCHHVRDLALVGIPISAACSAMKALLGSFVAVSSGMQGFSLCTRQLQTSSACTCDSCIQILRCMCQGLLKRNAAYGLACAASFTAFRRVNPSEGTLPSVIERVSTTARTNHCALFGLELPAVAVMLTMSLLLFPITAAQTCANPKLGQARTYLAAASLPSGLVFFAGGQAGIGTSVCVWQL